MTINDLDSHQATGVVHTSHQVSMLYLFLCWRAVHTISGEFTWGPQAVMFIQLNIEILDGMTD